MSVTLFRVSYEGGDRQHVCSTLKEAISIAEGRKTAGDQHRQVVRELTCLDFKIRELLCHALNGKMNVFTVGPVVYATA